MLDALYGRVLAWASWPVLALVIFAALLCNIGFQWRNGVLDKYAEQSPRRQGCERAVTLDGRLRGYSKADVRKLLDLIGAEGRRLYALTQVTLDLLFPFLYGSLFAMLLVRLSKPEQAWVLLFPVATVVFDLLENFTVATLAWTYDGKETSLATAASSFTMTKWGLLLLTLLLVGFRAVRSLGTQGS
jgi:hypothetical protein